MKVIDLVQGTPEWHKFRMEHLGSSDTPAIMGESKTTTPYQKWLDKLGLFYQKENWGMKLGKEYEPIARNMLCQTIGMEFLPAVAEDEKIPYLSSSFDGITKTRDFILEIKYSSEKNHDLVKQGKCPIEWYGQIQKQIYVSDAKAFLGIYFEKKVIALPIQRDQTYIDKMLEKESIFWQSLKTLEAPDLTERDYIHREDEEWMHNAGKLKQIQTIEKKAKRDGEELRNWFIQQSAGKNTEGGGLKLTKILKRGLVEYARIPELDGIDLEKYRKAPTEYWRIS